MLTIIIVIYKTDKKKLQSILNKIDINTPIIFVVNSLNYNFDDLTISQKYVLLNCKNNGNGAAINLAKTFTANNLGTFQEGSQTLSGAINQAMGSFNVTTHTMAYTKPSGSNNFIEYIQLYVNIDHATPRDVGLRLTSPQGTTLNVLQPFTNWTGNPNGTYLWIGVSGFYGEQIEGNWTLEIAEYTNNSSGGTLNQWGMKVYGN